LPAGDAPALQRIGKSSLCALFECTGPTAQVRDKKQKAAAQRSVAADCELSLLNRSA
jgi:hypothetical protein